MNRQWVLGFIESQGCFSIRISKNNGKLGYQVSPEFLVKTSHNNLNILEKLHDYFQVGHIYDDNGSFVWKVTKHKEVAKIALFLNSMHFVSPVKRKQFEYWFNAINLMQKKYHLNKNGLLEIARLRELMHDKNLWNKQHFCNIRLELDPCKPYQELGKLPEGCTICLKQKF